MNGDDDLPTDDRPDGEGEYEPDAEFVFQPEDESQAEPEKVEESESPTAEPVFDPDVELEPKPKAKKEQSASAPELAAVETIDHDELLALRADKRRNLRLLAQRKVISQAEINLVEATRAKKTAQDIVNAEWEEFDKILNGEDDDDTPLFARQHPECLPSAPRTIPEPIASVEATEEAAAHAVKTDGPANDVDESWRAVELATWDLPARIVKALAEGAKIVTVGDFAEFGKTTMNLHDIKGISVASAQKIDDAQAKFWKSWNSNTWPGQGDPPSV